MLKFVLILGKSCVAFVWGEKLGWPRTLFIILLAAALAISPFSKSEEESRFMLKWLEPPTEKIIVPDFFIFPIKMNPEQISIPDCTLDNPVKNSSGKISFCLLPCLHKDERLQVRLPTRFKIYSHPGNGNGNDSFSLGISIPENSLKFFRDLEKHLNALAMKKTKEVEKIGRSFARYDQGDFSLLKVDKSEQEKIYAKIYSSKLPNQDFSCRFWQLCGAKKKKPIPHPTKLINMPLRGQVVFSVKHLFCGNVKTITCIVDEVLVEEVVQSVSAFDDFEDRDESDLESDEDF